MATTTSMYISLNTELDGFVRDRVASGEYASTGEVVREGLRLLQARERAADESLASVRSKLQAASDQADRGDLVSGDEVFAKLDAIIERHRQNATNRP